MAGPNLLGQMAFAPAVIFSSRKVLTAAKSRLISRNRQVALFAPTGQWDSECLIARPPTGVHTALVRLARAYRPNGGVTSLARRPVPPAPRWCGHSSKLSAFDSIPHAGRTCWPAPDTAHADGSVCRCAAGRLRAERHRRPGHPGQGRPRQSPRCAWVGAAQAAPCDPAGRASGVRVPGMPRAPVEAHATG
jgi:hypothetical protein